MPAGRIAGRGLEHMVGAVQRTRVSLIVGGLIGALINWYFVWRAESPKRLVYEVLNKTSLVNGRHSPYALSVVRRLKNPNVTLIRIGNAGEQPIVSEDFRGTPIRINFEPACILARRHTDKQNPDISLIWSTDTGSTYTGVTPELLNPGEWFELQFRTDGGVVEPQVSARVVGETHRKLAM